MPTVPRQGARVLTGGSGAASAAAITGVEALRSAADVGAASQEFGAALSQFGVALQDRRDRLDAQQEYTRTATELNNIFSQKYSTRQGVDARGVSEDFTAEATRLRDLALGRMESPGSRARLEAELDPYVARKMSQATDFEVQQQRVAEIQAHDLSRQQAIENVKSFPASPENLQDSVERINALWDENPRGHTAEAVATMREQDLSNVHETAILLTLKSPGGLDLAELMADRYSDDLVGEARTRVSAEIIARRHKQTAAEVSNGLVSQYVSGNIDVPSGVRWIQETYGATDLGELIEDEFVAEAGRMDKHLTRIEQRENLRITEEVDAALGRGDVSSALDTARMVRDPEIRSRLVEKVRSGETVKTDRVLLQNLQAWADDPDRFDSFNNLELAQFDDRIEKKDLAKLRAAQANPDRVAWSINPWIKTFDEATAFLDRKETDQEKMYQSLHRFVWEDIQRRRVSDDAPLTDQEVRGSIAKGLLQLQRPLVWDGDPLHAGGASRANAIPSAPVVRSQDDWEDFKVQYNSYLGNAQDDEIVSSYIRWVEQNKEPFDKFFRREEGAFETDEEEILRDSVGRAQLTIDTRRAQQQPDYPDFAYEMSLRGHRDASSDEMAEMYIEWVNRGRPAL